MAITSNDIKLMQSERLTEDSDGGGQMTGLPVIDGDINNLFEDISRVNRTYGDVSLRKAFLKVDTATADLYLDSHAIISAQPQDPNVSGLLFTTSDFYDERASARERIESFVIKGPEAFYYLRGDQLSGQQTIICYAPSINLPREPEIGDTFLLESNGDPQTQQFIKIVDVVVTDEIYTYDLDTQPKTFKAKQYVIRLSAPLRRTYLASPPNPFPRSASRLFTTQTSNSAKYYGTTTLAASAAAGATSILVANTFAPIVPTASTERPVIDQRPGGYVSHIIPTGDVDITLPVAIAPGTISALPGAIVPGTMRCVVAGASYSDKAGVFVNDAGTAGGLQGTEIDYFGGQIRWAGTVTADGVNLTYRHGTTRAQIPNTARIDIGDSNRSFNYVLTLDPPPGPLTFNASYLYLGKWYELRDDGAGALLGDGSGQVDYKTGSVILTLQAQPDAGSVIFYRWSEMGLYATATGDSYSSNPLTTLQLTHTSLLRGSVSITWLAAGVTKTATDADGDIVGDATGTIDYASGRITLVAATQPDAGNSWHVQYRRKSQGVESSLVSVPNNTTRANINLTSASNVAPGTLSFVLRNSFKHEVYNSSNVLLSASYIHRNHLITDNGIGQLIDRHRNELVGTINYTTGAITVTGTAFLQSYNRKQAATLLRTVVGAETINATKYNNKAIIEEIVAHNVTVNYQLAAGTEADDQQSFLFNATPWSFTLVTRGPITAGSVVLSIADQLWFDNAEGVLWSNYSTATGSGVAAGTIDYASGIVRIPYYTGRPVSTTVTALGCVVGEDWAPIRTASFRVNAAPLRPNGFTVRAQHFTTGAQLNAQADAEGDLNGDGIIGAVDLQSGVADVTFPAPVVAATLFYNAVSFKQVPLDPDILGLDPVRLPSDGRVPIIRDADILVLTHTRRDLIDTPDDGLLIAAGRDRLHAAWIEDSHGTQLDPDQYTLNKTAGTATLAVPFVAQDADSNPLVGNLFFVHRIDDMALCTEARINGALQLAQPLYHAFPEGETWVASAVYMGNLRARVTGWVSYTTDPGYGGIGTLTSAQYNLVAYPIAIDNRGSVPERWKIVFTSSSAFNLFGEKRGLVGDGSIFADFSPVNPQTGTPYFTVKLDGWGSGWAIGNSVRFDTDAAASPLWLIRTVLPGQATVDDDQLKIELRGDHN